MEIILRPIEKRDAAEVARLSGQFGYPVTKEEMQMRLSEMLTSSTDWLWVAESNGQVVAWMQATAMARLESGRFLEITGFVVEETQRSGGIGGKMLALVTDFGKENGFERLVVRSNVIRNRAHGFYLKNGFEEKKQQKVFEKRIFHAGG
jgi:N-acetylglutamate synthase-like GNAT family acetyltransferase